MKAKAEADLQWQFYLCLREGKCFQLLCQWRGEDSTEAGSTADTEQCSAFMLVPHLYRLQTLGMWQEWHREITDPDPGSATADLTLATKSQLKNTTLFLLLNTYL